MPTADILAGLGAAAPPGQVLVGFAAETGDGLARAREKRERKGVDLVVLNDVSRADIGFEVDENEVALVGADGVEHLPKAVEVDGRRGDPGPRRAPAGRAGVTELGRRSYDDLLAALAAPAATPGGGTAAALAAGFACALVERCAAAAGQLDAAARAAELRRQLVAIGEDDVAAVTAGGSGPPRRLRAAAAELEQAAAALERAVRPACGARPAWRACWPRQRCAPPTRSSSSTRLDVRPAESGYDRPWRRSGGS